MSVIEKKIAAVVCIWLTVLACWFGNLFGLLSCDFESDYKCEVTHGIGVVIPYAAPITVWFGDDRNKE